MKNKSKYKSLFEETTGEIIRLVFGEFPVNADTNHYHVPQKGSDSNPVLFHQADRKKIAKCESLIVRMNYHCPTYLDDSSAFYHPAVDHITMPHFKYFTSTECFYGTFFHEMIHSTALPHRLNRPEILQYRQSITPAECLEEITAELGAAFLCGKAGIFSKTLLLHAGYIRYYLDKSRVYGLPAVFFYEAMKRAQDAFHWLVLPPFQLFKVITRNPVYAPVAHPLGHAA